jgi:hypothetical protein
MVHGGPAAPSSTGAHRRAHRAVPHGTKAHRGGAGRERATTQISPRPKSGGAVARLCRRQRGMEHGVDAPCWMARGTDKWSEMGQNAAGKMAEVVAPFIGLKRQRRGGETVR